MRSVANFRRWPYAIFHGWGRADFRRSHFQKRHSGGLPQGLSAQELPCPRRRRPFSVLDGGVGRLQSVLIMCKVYSRGLGNAVLFRLRSVFLGGLAKTWFWHLNLSKRHEPKPTATADHPVVHPIGLHLAQRAGPAGLTGS